MKYMDDRGNSTFVTSFMVLVRNDDRKPDLDDCHCNVCLLEVAILYREPV